MKKKKEKKKLTKKDKIILILITIILGTGAYFLGAKLTKDYLDKENEKANKIDFSEMTKLETIENISLKKLITSYNKILKEKNLDKYTIKQDKMEKKDSFYEYTTNNITYVFQVTNNSVDIMSIYYKEENDEVKEIIKLAIKANNDNLSDEDINMVYDSVIRTRNNKEENNSKTSEYFQYKGLETSLKETILTDKSLYQFRIGRITE